MWVLGGLLAVVVPSDGRLGIFLIALVLLFAGLWYVGSVRRGYPEAAPGDGPPIGDAPAPADAPAPPRKQPTGGEAPE